MSSALRSKSSTSIETLLSKNSSKRLKRVAYLHKVFTSHKQYKIPKDNRNVLKEEYDRLLFDVGDNWEEEYKKLREKEEAEGKVDDTGLTEFVDQEEKSQQDDDDAAQDSSNAEADEEDEWSDAMEDDEEPGSFSTAEEEDHLDLLSVPDDTATQSTVKNTTSSNVTPSATKRKSRKKTAASKTTPTKKRKRATTTKRKGTKRKTKEQLEQEIEEWKETISTLYARYRGLVDTVLEDDMTAMLLSLDSLPETTDASPINFIKWINSHTEQLQNVKQSLEIDCSLDEFKVLFLYSLAQYRELDCHSRLIVRLDPKSYLEHPEVKKQKKLKEQERRRASRRRFQPAFTAVPPVYNSSGIDIANIGAAILAEQQKQAKKKTPAVIYIDCEEDEQEPPSKKRKTNDGAAKETKKTAASSSSGSPIYPAEHLMVEFYLDEQWKCVKLGKSGKLSTKPKVIPVLKEKREFPFFVLGMLPEFSVNLTEKFLNISPAKDTVTVQNNFNTIIKWFREADWCTKKYADSEDSDEEDHSELDQVLAQEQKELNKLFSERRTKLPKSQSAYRNHPLYILEKFITRYQAIYPKETKPAGHCGDHAVYKRENLRELHTKDKWLSEHSLEVLPDEVAQPYKIIKSHSSSKKGMTHLFGKWQTRKYTPPTAVDGIVPKNDRGQVDLWNKDMLPIGCVHMGNRPYIANVCKKLKIDYAPCMVGFEVRNHRSVPKFDGVVVCKEHKDVLDDAYHEYMQKRAQRAEEKRKKRIYDNWDKLVRGLLAREKAKKIFNGDDSGKVGTVESEEI